MKKITLTILLLLTGCASVPNVKELDFGITGLEMEFYEPSAPTQEEGGIFKKSSWFSHNADIDRVYNEKKNRSSRVKYPELMPMIKK
jgi:hypothetical protein|tara:strand:- start:358 stop:618 length:261 start_codon:yes stop_codon:yes gene_type:complete